MLIEIHMIQNHSPANLNRDDLGAPKTCIFGGVTRARISSQCLKRSIRRSPEFAAALEKDGGVRTRRLIELIANAAVGEGNQPNEQHLTAIRKVFTDGGIGLKNENTFDILFFLPQSAINEMGAAVRSGNGDLGKKFAEIIGKLVKTPDIALCGRMTEFEAKGSFKDLKGQFTVEAALSAAHAISTHEVVNEVDYFTAADDVRGQDAGAAHVNEAIFNSACFYKHFVIDFDQLKKNLANDADLALKTVRCFLEAAVKANPSGKQHAFAAFNPPDGVLVEVKTKSATPVSYANAFADPVPEKCERGLIGESITRLGQYAHDLVAGYGIEADRFWFSPNLRHRLTWIDTSKKQHEQEQSVVGSKEFGEFDQFVNKVMDKMMTTDTPAEATK
ncbi:MAG TPA: type I-E CRISPR-associated protein Cas7/Cse4/CasC [Acidobacteriota bacterium]|nr:type I-E CRISPR-associated protein Cas7/Cse4/CasC [Candidatus Latescibacterota bacterium]HQF87679.1 type I-E CRISPR-associated protein Cas7/Cse4/CasC [Acidobacteriota bacterium]HQG93346.1 type I-E CRISPR-associated protein Cas7/Cse4/CasC [Acidobacteriota bacterium]HQK87759.1 type I-E CRISPR-associated protein Cas7/Cse4/CasC [Acidobacteriota bacterium]